MRQLRAAMVAAVAVVTLSGCQAPQAQIPTPSPIDNAIKVVDCATSLRPSLQNALTLLPGAAGKLSLFYNTLDTVRDVAAALEAAYGKDWTKLTPDEQASLFLIATGINACEGISDIPEVIRGIFAIELFKGITLSPTLKGKVCIPGGAPPFDNAGNLKPVDQLQLELCDPSSAVTDASLGGDFTLTRTLRECINFEQNCAATPMPVRLENCTQAQCDISRTDGIWKRSHTIEAAGTGWTGAFDDIAITCGSNDHSATITIRFTPTDAAIVGDAYRVTAIDGTYEVVAATNPGCAGNVRASWTFSGVRK